MSLTLGDLGIVKFNRSGGYEDHAGGTWSHALTSNESMAALGQTLSRAGLVSESGSKPAIRYALLKPEQPSSKQAAALARAKQLARAHAARAGINVASCSMESSFIVDRDFDDDPKNDPVVAIFVTFRSRSPGAAPVVAQAVVDLPHQRAELV